MTTLHLRHLMVASAAVLLISCDSAPKDESAEAAPPPERHIPLEGQSNFRDLGGYKTTDGRTVRWRQVFRTGELGKLSDADVEKLDELKLKTMVNFLLPEEIEKHGKDRLPEGVEAVLDPITGEKSAELSMTAQDAITSGDFDKLPAEINLEIHAILMDEAKEQYARLLRRAADPANHPIAFHCSHGVHRTGTASAILLSALGVPWDTIREDYVLTNEVRKEENEETFAKLRAKVASDRGVDPESIDMTNLKAFYILEGAYIDGALEAATKEYGSMDDYIREGLGLTEEEIAALKDSLLE